MNPSILFTNRVVAVMRCLLIRLTLMTLLLTMATTPCLAQTTLQGRVEQNAQAVDGNLEGQVLDAQTGKPVAGAQVTLPDQRFGMTTGPDGAYSVPQVRGKSPVIMSITRPGYMPFSVSISENTPPKLRITLTQVSQTLVLDDTLRHLGDDSFNPMSNGAFQFRKAADGPDMTYHFMAPATSRPVTLQIGSIIGLDTQLSHMLSGNRIGVWATPLLVVLNGQTVAQVAVDGDNRRIQLPRQDLNIPGNNTLEIKAGYHYPEPGRIDYDDMEYIHVVIQF